MKRFILILATALILGACSKDDAAVFEASIPQENISFTPKRGGATMHYTLPAESDIYSIMVRYEDVNGKEVTMKGSYHATSMELIGFNKARQGVPVFISLLDKNDNQSREMEMTFDTEDSIPYAFFEHAEVSDSWGGFKLTYELEEPGQGIAHVYYVGKLPGKDEMGELRLQSFSLANMKGDMYFPVQQDLEEITVVVKTEDFRGYIVREERFEGVKAPAKELYPKEKFDFLDPFNKSIEEVERDRRLGIQYAFDGDFKGYRRLNHGTGNSYTAYTFLAGPDAWAKDGVYWVIDLKEPQVVASVKLYASLPVATWYTQPFYQAYLNYLPSEATVYVSNDKDDPGSWKKAGYFFQEALGSYSTFWGGKYGSGYEPAFKTAAELDQVDPLYMELVFDITKDEYRYIKLEVQQTSLRNGTYSENRNRYVSFNELEVEVKKQ